MRALPRDRSPVPLRPALVLSLAAGLGVAIALAGPGCSSPATPSASLVSLGVIGAPAAPAPPAHGTPVRIADVRAGDVVTLEGTLLRHLDDGELRLAGGSGTIRVVVPGLPRVPAAEGERIRVEGVVHDPMTFGLARPHVRATAIVLASGARVELPEADGAAPAAASPPAESGGADGGGEAGGGERPAGERSVGGHAGGSGVVPIGSLRRGQAATVRGTVQRILDTDEFRLADDSGSVRVYVGWRNRVPADVGAVVTVSGVMDDDPWPLRNELYADAIILADGTRIDLRTGTRTPPAEGRGGSGGDASSEDAGHRVGSGSPRASGASSSAASPLADAPSIASGAVAVVPIADAPLARLVAVRGTVERITDEDELRLRDDSGSIAVYVGWRNRVPVSEGATVTVLGAIDAKGPDDRRRELYAVELMRADGTVVPLQRPGAATESRDVAIGGAPAGGGSGPDAGPDAGPERSSAAATTALGGPVTAVSAVRRGQRVVLVGVVDRLRDSDEFVLRDDTGTIEVYVGWRNRMPVRPGDRVAVAGVADDDVLPGRRPDVYADRIELPDGSVVRLLRDD